jgi:hypothetical protein
VSFNLISQDGRSTKFTRLRLTKSIEARIIPDKTYFVIMRIRTERYIHPWLTSYNIGDLSE